MVTPIDQKKKQKENFSPFLDFIKGIVQIVQKLSDQKS
jgi:hypothetical protein